MPNIANKNGIDMGNIASMNGQDVASSGGAYNPADDSGTYTETVPTSGLIKTGGQNIGFSSASSGGKTDSSKNEVGFCLGTTVNQQFQSDKDGRFMKLAETLPGGLARPVKVIEFGAFGTNGSNWIIDANNKLWRVSTSSSWGGTGADRRTWNQITGTGDSDTGWTKVSSGALDTLAINSGKLYYMGNNSSGAFGIGSTSSQYSSFAQVGSDSDWTDVINHYGQSIALKGGAVYTAGSNSSWGWNTGTDTSSGNVTTWTAIDATNLHGGSNSNFIKIFSSSYWAGAIQETTSGDGYGKLFCWGKVNKNCNGKPSQNGTWDSAIPVQCGFVNGAGSTAADWVDLAPFYNHSLAINSSGQLFSAGEAGQYQGLSSTTTDREEGYVQVGSDTDWSDCNVQISQWVSHTYGAFARKTNGNIYFTGWNNGHIIDQGTASFQYSSPTVVGTAAASYGWHVTSDSSGGGSQILVTDVA